MAKRLCTEQVESDILNELLSCRLVPLNKNPGVRPIGVGEVLRRIIGKAVMKVLKDDIVHAGGTLQTCAGIDSGIEAAVHSMADVFKKDENEALLLVDASNAFNSMNRVMSLNTVKNQCPSFYQYLKNTYQVPTHQYISGSKEGHFVWSEEGATQGDNCAMAYYAIGTTPIISKLHEMSNATQVFYADDNSACGTLETLLDYWKKLLIVGPDYGYFPNATKTVLIVKEECNLSKAKQFFEPLGVKVTSDGQRHLGAIVGSAAYKETYVKDKVQKWVKDVEALAEIAKDEPQLAYACYTKGLSHRWTYVMRTIPGISELMAPLEEAISQKLITSIVGRSVSDLERQVFELPVRFGGMGMPSPVNVADREYTCSREVTKSLVDLIIKQDLTLTEYSKDLVREKKLYLKAEKEANHKLQFEELCSKVDSQTKRAMCLAREKGASAWLTALPLKALAYTLNKQEFRDGIALRYSWHINNIPRICPCGSKNSLLHTIDCKLGGFVAMRHDSLKYRTAGLLRNAGCKDVKIEPELLPVTENQFHHRTNTQSAARLDVSAVGVWSRFEKSMFDIRVTHPNCFSNLGKSPADIYKEHENLKKVEYEERVLQSEQASFTPLIFTTSGGMGPQCSSLFKKIGNMIAEKKKDRYADVINHIRTGLRFDILKSTLIGIRGERGRVRKHDRDVQLYDVSLNILPIHSAYECP